MTATQTAIAAAQPVAARSVSSLVAVAVLVVLVFTLRLPSLAEPHHYTDEGIFAATAQRLLDGETLYSGAWDDKPPLIFLVYAAVLTLAGPSMVALRLAGVACSAATALAVLGIGRRVGGERTGWLAALLYAVLAALPLVEGTLLLTEPLMALPAAVAVLLVLDAAGRSGSARDWCLVGAGALLGTAFLFKQVAALDATAAGIWLLCGRGRSLKDAALLVAGWVVPVAVIVLWLATGGALSEAWHGVFGFYGTYLQEGSAAPAGFKVLRLLPAGVALGWVLWRRRSGTVTPRDLPLLWLGFALVGATLAGRPFGHYLVQVLAPFAVVVADLTPRPPSLARKGVPGRDVGTSLEGRDTPTVARSTAIWRGTPFLAREGGRGVRSAVLALTLLTVIAGFRGFWFGHPTLTPAYYGNWAAWVTGHRSEAAYDEFYSWRVADQRDLARLMEADPGWAAADGKRTLFVWGEYPWLYPLAEARNPTRYSTAYLTSYVPGAKAEVMRALQRDPPRYVVQELGEWRRLPGLTEFLAQRYEIVARVDSAVLWRLRD